MSKFTDGLVGNAKHVDYKTMIGQKIKVSSVIFYNGPEWVQRYGRLVETGYITNKCFIFFGDNMYTITKSKLVMDKLSAILKNDAKVTEADRESAYIITENLKITFKYTAVEYADGNSYDVVDFDEDKLTEDPHN